MNASPSSTPSVQQLTVSVDQAGQRLDNFLMARLKGVPRSRIYRIIRSGEVRVNSGRAKPSHKLADGDCVRVPPIRTSTRDRADPGGGLLKLLAGAILFEDDGLLVINKPAGLAVHGGSGVAHGLIESLRAQRPSAPFLELVHRLDRDTSGCLMVAKKRSVLRHLHAQLRDGGLSKRYLTLVAGRWPRRKVRVNAALERDVVRGGERLVRASASGRVSETRFKVIQYYADCTLLEAMPTTGRTHQIRVHTAAVGHPVAGDDKYGDRDFNREIKKQGLRRLFLHAAALDIVSSAGVKLHVEAPLEETLESVLSTLAGARNAADL